MDTERPFEEQDLRIADLVQREGRALVLGMNKWDLAGGQARRQAARRGRPLAAAGQGRADRRAVRTARRGPRPADAGGGRRPCGVEPARLDQPAEPLVRGCGVVASAARRERPAPQAQLHHAGRKRARRASCCSARAPTRCRRATCAIWSTACATRFDLPGTPIRITLREKANPFAAQEEEAAMSDDQAVMTRRRRQRRAARAFVFIFITVLLDMLALGIIIPVLPRLVVDFMGGDAPRAAEVLGMFGTAWALMQFLFSPMIGALSDRFGRRPVILAVEYRARPRLHPDGGRAVAVVAVRRARHFRHHGGEHLGGLRLCRRRDACRAARGALRHARRRVRRSASCSGRRSAD